MKTLTLLRHAKSGEDGLAARDIDRRLNPKGRRAARAMGRHLREAGLSFDRVIASPAMRVRETIAEVEGGYGGRLDPHWDRRLYLASAAELVEILREQPAAADRLLLVGHNSGLEDLVLTLVPEGDGVPRDRVAEKYPTGSLAVMSLPIPDWEGLASGTAHLDGFVRPRDLDPAFGPDFP